LLGSSFRPDEQHCLGPGISRVGSKIFHREQ
jgi:hypothetical protein